MHVPAEWEVWAFKHGPSGSVQTSKRYHSGSDPREAFLAAARGVRAIVAGTTDATQILVIHRGVVVRQLAVIDDRGQAIAVP